MSGVRFTISHTGRCGYQIKGERRTVDMLVRVHRKVCPACRDSEIITNSEQVYVNNNQIFNRKLSQHLDKVQSQRIGKCKNQTFISPEYTQEIQDKLNE